MHEMRKRGSKETKRFLSLKTIKYREISPRTYLSGGEVYVKRAIPLAGVLVCDRLSGTDALRHARDPDRDIA